MKLKPQFSIKFYQNLGRLFYALAIADNCVRDEELKTLENSIANEWMILGDFNRKDQKNTPLLILKTFKQLRDENKNDADYYFNCFINFKRSNGAFFNEDVIALILKTASNLAAAFSGKNKSELILLAKLNLELKKQNS